MYITSRLSLRHSFLLLALFPLCSGALSASAEDLAAPSSHEVVVTADRVELPRSDVASVVAVITAEDIERRQDSQITDALQMIPGINVVESGGLGGNASVFLRGANSEHTLVIIDGMEVNDPISPTRAFNFSGLTPDNIERIEVIRGPQSVLYGSDAIGGVISITTKKGKGSPSGTASVEGGSFDSFTERASIGGSESMLDYSLAASREDSGGISAAGAKYGNREKDGYGNTTFSSRIGVTPSEEFGLSTFFRLNRSGAELDNVGGVGGDDPNRDLGTRRAVGRIEANTSFFNKVLRQKWGVGFLDQRIDDNNFFDEHHPLDQFVSNYQGKTVKLDLQNDVRVSDKFSALLGAETRQERGSSSYLSESSFGPYNDILDDKTARNNGYYLQGRWNLAESLITTGGVRVDTNPAFGSETTWKVGPVLKLGSTRLHSTVGTGYKAPSIFQLYSSYGNELLEPEKSFGWDAGVEQDLLEKRVTGGLTFFHTRYDHLISFNPVTFVSENIAEATTKGIELFTTVVASDGVELRGSYTFTDAQDDGTQNDLLRRARHKVAGEVNVVVNERVHLNLTLTYVGRSYDNDFSTYPASRVELGGYPLAGAAVSVAVTPKVELFARVQNAFDKEYEEVLGFGAEGAAAYGGVKVHL